MKLRTAVIVMIAIMLALSTFGCAGSPKAAEYDYNTSAEQSWDSMPVEAPAAAEESMVAEEYGLSDTAGTTQSVVDLNEMNTEDIYGGRKVIRTENVSIETNEFDEHYEKLVSTAQSMGGYVQSSDISGRKPEVYNDPGRYATLSFRIPSDKVDAFLSVVTACGTVIQKSGSAEDITSQYFDMETRLDVLRTQLERLRAILVETDNLADVIQLETEIARVTLEIEELTTELRRYDGLVDYSTVFVYIDEQRLIEGPVSEDTVGTRIDEGFSDTLHGVGEFFVDLFVFLVAASPVLVILAILALGVIFIIKGAKKKKAKKLQYKASKPEEPEKATDNDDKEKTNNEGKNG